MNRGKSLERAVAQLLDLMHLPYMRVDIYRCPKCGFVGNVKAKGAADFIVMVSGTPGKLIGLECKEGTGRQTPDQRAWENAWTDAGGEYVLVHQADSVLEIFKEYRR